MCPHLPGGNTLALARTGPLRKKPRQLRCSLNLNGKGSLPLSARMMIKLIDCPCGEKGQFCSRVPNTKKIEREVCGLSRRQATSRPPP